MRAFGAPSLALVSNFHALSGHALPGLSLRSTRQARLPALGVIIERPELPLLSGSNRRSSTADCRDIFPVSAQMASMLGTVILF
jgi:hypothetical protein